MYIKKLLFYQMSFSNHWEHLRKYSNYFFNSPENSEDYFVSEMNEQSYEKLCQMADMFILNINGSQPIGNVSNKFKKIINENLIF